MATIAIVLGQDFEDAELRKPYDALVEAGHTVEIVGAEAGEVVTGKRGTEKVKIDVAAVDRSAADYDALVIPGGYSPDHLRTDDAVVELVREFMEQGKLVAAVCHGPQLLIEADVVEGRTLTSWPSVRTDLENAGASWVDEVVCIDDNLVTSRKPADLDAFSEAILARLEDASWARPDEEDVFGFDEEEAEEPPPVSPPMR